MSKLTREQKEEIYDKHKKGYMLSKLAKEYGVLEKNIYYLVKLIEYHGIGVLRDGKNRRYSKYLKQEIIDKVLIHNQSVKSIAIEYGFSSDGIVFNWIKSYKENGYVIVEKKRGRKSTMNKQTIKKEYEDMTDGEKIKYLQEKNIYLEAEVGYLKKLRAVVQARKNQQPKRK